MTRIQRISICGTIVASGLAAQAALEAACRSERPTLRRPLSSLPMEFGDWVGADRPVSPDLVRQAQSTEHLSRVYESRKRPGVKLELWVNYSLHGHEPPAHARDLPAVGRIDQDRVDRRASSTCPPATGAAIKVSRLGYGQGELV